MKIIIVIDSVRACVRTSAEDDDFQRLSKGGGMCAAIAFIEFERFYVLVLDVTFFRISLGLLGISC